MMSVNSQLLPGQSYVIPAPAPYISTVNAGASVMSQKAVPEPPIDRRSSLRRKIVRMQTSYIPSQPGLEPTGEWAIDILDVSGLPPFAGGIIHKDKTDPFVQIIIGHDQQCCEEKENAGSAATFNMSMMFSNVYRVTEAEARVYDCDGNMKRRAQPWVPMASDDLLGFAKFQLVPGPQTLALVSKKGKPAGTLNIRVRQGMKEYAKGPVQVPVQSVTIPTAYPVGAPASVPRAVPGSTTVYRGPSYTLQPGQVQPIYRGASYTMPVMMSASGKAQTVYRAPSYSIAPGSISYAQQPVMLSGVQPVQPMMMSAPMVAAGGNFPMYSMQSITPQQL